MAAINSVKELVDADTAGKTNSYVWRKVPTQVTTASIWFDLSSSPGMPVPQYYAATPLAATTLAYSSDRGIFHGYDVSPATKYVRKSMAMANTIANPLPMMLLDYLMFYPFIDEGSTDQQDMINTNSLTRYTDGKGVQVMAVSQGARTGGQTFTFTYTNSAGVSGRTSKTIIENTASANGHIVSSSTATAGATGPFCGLQSGDTGVRSIQSVTMQGADVGLFALVLVKPLVATIIREATAPNEIDFFLQNEAIPEIKTDAYLNWICLPGASLSAIPILGDLQTVWN